MFNATSALNNVIIGTQAGDTLTTGSDNVCIGDLADLGAAIVGAIVLGHNSTVSGNNSIAIGQNITNSTANTCIIGNSSNTVIEPGADNVTDLGSSSKRYKDIYASNGSIITTSDIRQKDIYPSMNFGLNELLLLNPIAFKWKDYTIEETDLEGEITTIEQTYTRTHYGFGSQHIKQLIDENK